MDKKRQNNLAYGNLLLSVLVVALGVALITFSEQLAQRLPSFAAAFFVFQALILTIRALLYGRSRLSSIAFVSAGVYFLIAVGIVIARVFLGLSDVEKIIAITLAVYSFADAGEAFIDILNNRKDVRRIFVDVVVITIHVVLGIGLLTNNGESIAANLALYGTVFVVRGMLSVLQIMGERIKVNAFVNVLIKTHAMEVLSGLLFTVIAASVVFPLIEPEIKTFGDAMWYSFALITTIGFGDFSAVTPLGRVISVAIGLYGIIVVALITSIFVNMYADSKRSGDEEQRSATGGVGKFASVTDRIAKVVTGKEIGAEGENASDEGEKPIKKKSGRGAKKTRQTKDRDE